MSFTGFVWEKNRSPALKRQSCVAGALQSGLLMNVRISFQIFNLLLTQKKLYGQKLSFIIKMTEGGIWKMRILLVENEDETAVFSANLYPGGCTPTILTVFVLSHPAMSKDIMVWG